MFQDHKYWKNGAGNTTQNQNQMSAATLARSPPATAPTPE
jgi:hypothetical protein